MSTNPTNNPYFAAVRDDGSPVRGSPSVAPPRGRHVSFSPAIGGDDEPADDIPRRAPPVFNGVRGGNVTPWLQTTRPEQYDDYGATNTTRTRRSSLPLRPPPSRSPFVDMQASSDMYLQPPSEARIAAQYGTGRNRRVLDDPRNDYSISPGPPAYRPPAVSTPERNPHHSVVHPQIPRKEHRAT